jgi:hypothetical protein
MASIVVTGDTSGSVTLSAPSVSGSTVLTLPTSSGTLVVTGGAQTIEFADGSAAAPSITNSGDTNTGMFFPAADSIGFTEGGTESMRIDSSGHVIVGHTASVGTAYQTNMQVKGGGTASTYAGYGLITSNNESAGLFGVYSNSENSLWIASDPDNLRSGSRTVFTVDGTEVASVVAGGNFSFNSGYGSSAVAYGCRAWVNFNGTTNVGGNCTIRASANVSSVADNGTGDYTVNLTTAMPDGNYSAVSSGGTGSNNIRMCSCSPVSATSTSQIRVIGITVGAGSLIDLDVVSVAIFR